MSRIIVAMLLGWFAVNSANGSIINFDGTADNQDVPQFSQGGLTFTNNGGSFMYVFDSTSPNSNGTDNLIFSGFTGNDFLRITKTGGGSFDLNSIDMTISWYNSNASETIFINGNQFSIFQGLTTLNVNLTGVTQVDITRMGGDGYWLADNFNVNLGNAIPEPGSFLVWGVLGLASLGLNKRRRER
jgi:hypothetical protein